MRTENPLKLRIIAIVVLLLFSSGHALELFKWEPTFCDLDCPGSWVEVESQPEHFRRSQVHISVFKQRFDFKKKIMSGEDLEILGKSLWIRAKNTKCEYEAQSRHWALKGPILAWIDDVYLESQFATYDQSQEHFQARNVEFFFKKYNLYGTATSVSSLGPILEMRDLITTQCPPHHQTWSLRIDSMIYDMEKQHLVLSNPGFFIYNYQIFQLDEFSFDGLRAQHYLENIPRFHVETSSGLTLQMPIVWTKENETIALIPEINSKQGIGIGASILKNTIYGKGFFQLIPFSQDIGQSWMLSTASHEKNANFSYGYQASLVSDPAFGYRYPNAVEFWNNLYLVNYGWISKKTDLGKITFSTEKLYRSQEARENNYESIEYLARFDWSTENIIRLNAGADIIHRYDDKTYQRIRWQADYDLGSQRGFSYRLSSYPKDGGVYTGSLLCAAKTNPCITKAGIFEIYMAGSLANSVDSPLLLDTIAQPISPSFFKEAQWHSGLDWNSRGAWITPQWSLDLAPKLQALLSLAYALKRPNAPWGAPAQPYLTPFRGADRFSPLSLTVLGDRWSTEMLYDLSRGQCIMAQWGSSLDFPDSMVDLRLFYHKYYPMDRLSQIVQSVAQLHYQYHLKKVGPWSVDLQSSWDLIPIELARAGINLTYDECCWKSHLKASADRRYDPESHLPQWHYSVGFRVEIYALGLLNPKVNPWTFEKPSSKRFVTKGNW